MKRATLIGAVAFLLGAASSPRAANDNETRAMLCARFGAAHGLARIHEIRVLFPGVPFDSTSRAVFNAEANALEIVRDTLCR